MTKAGNRHGRWLATEWAGSGGRYPPERALSGWCRERLGGGGQRLRRMGLVAGARKLLLALWQFGATGALPEGAALTGAETSSPELLRW